MHLVETFFLDYENNVINFEFIKCLYYLQDNKECHLVSKVRMNNILFFKQYNYEDQTYHSII